MTNIQTNNKTYKVLVDSKLESVDSFNSTDLVLLLNNELVKKDGDNIKVEFVGEVITPNTNYISLPKRFSISDNNINLTISLLKKYKNLKKNDKILLTNKIFSPTYSGIESPLFYFKKLKEYFLDYITYEFIYPEERIEIHSSTPIQGGIMNVVKTEKNVKMKGPGITYLVKDMKNSEKWNLDDIYFTTLTNLMNEYGSEKDIMNILSMEKYLKLEGYEFNIIDINEDSVLQNIKNCNVDIIHNPIKNTLLKYYSSKNVGGISTINIFHTKNFNLVWEYLIKIALHHSKDFKKELKDKFTKVDIKTDFIPISKLDEVEKEVQNSPDKYVGVRKVGKDHYLDYYVKDFGPDIFSEFPIGNKRFIGDAKYYSNIDNALGIKEYDTYNNLMENKYPMVIFAPGDITRVDTSNRRREGLSEIIIFEISVEDVIKDVVIGGNNQLITRVQSLIKKRTKRW
jgi:hypothetical protein